MDTPYRLQLGRVDDKWASRILHGAEVIALATYNDADLPRMELIAGWCLKMSDIPINSMRSFRSSIHFLRRETERNWEITQRRSTGLESPIPYIPAENPAGQKTYAVIPQVIPARSAPPASNAKRGKVVVPAGSYAYKIVLADETAEGKSLPLQPFVESKFDTDYKSTIGTSIMKKELIIPGSDARVRFIIWDLAIQDHFRRVWQTYFQNAEAGIVIFDVTRREAFGAVEQWVIEARRGSGKPDLPVILVGTNASMPGREVSHEEGVTLGKKLGLPYVENTGPPRDLVNGIFELLARILVIKQSL